MGLFDNAASYEEIRKQADGSTGGRRKYLHQGVFPVTFVNAEIFEASTGNVALVMKYDTGFVTSAGEPNILFKHYYVLDRSTLSLPFNKDPRPLQGQRLIDQASFLKVREMLALLFDLPIENVSSIRLEWETGKIGGMARQITRQLCERPGEGRQVAGTVDYERSPNREGKFFLGLEWLNPIGQLERRQNSFKPKDNPNPTPDSHSNSSSPQDPPQSSDPHWDEEPLF